MCGSRPQPGGAPLLSPHQLSLQVPSREGMPSALCPVKPCTVLSRAEPSAAALQPEAEMPVQQPLPTCRREQRNKGLLLQNTSSGVALLHRMCVATAGYYHHAEKLRFHSEGGKPH